MKSKEGRNNENNEMQKRAYTGYVVYRSLHAQIHPMLRRAMGVDTWRHVFGSGGGVAVISTPYHNYTFHFCAFSFVFKLFPLPSLYCEWRTGFHFKSFPLFTGYSSPSSNDQQYLDMNWTWPSSCNYKLQGMATLFPESASLEDPRFLTRVFTGPTSS